MQRTTPSRSLWFRWLVPLAFLVSVNLLAGGLAVWLRYESLWNVQVGFAEYALPLPFCWGLAHLPSQLLGGLLLFFLPTWPKRGVDCFRTACLAVFLLALLEGDRQIPFLLFPKVDAAAALLFSLVAVPPNRRENPRLVAALGLIALAAGLLLGYVAYATWTHRTPEVTVTRYADGAFTLQAIAVHNDHRKSVVFDVALTTALPEDQACLLAQALAEGVLRDYPFDPGYDKVIEVTYSPASPPADFQPYPLGEIRLNDKDRERDGRFACYLKYK